MCTCWRGVVSKPFSSSSSLSTERDEIIGFNNNLRKRKSLAVYKTYQGQYRRYCYSTNINPDVPSAEHLCKFLMSKYENESWSSASTYNLARSAIADLYRYNDSDTSIGENKLVCATVKNISKQLPEATQKKPFTTDLLLTIANKIDITSYMQVRNYYMMLLMVGTFMRESAVVLIEMKRVNIINVNNRDVLEIEHKPIKSSNNKQKKTYVDGAINNTLLDIITWHRLYVSMPAIVKSSLYLFHCMDSGGKLADNTAWHAFKYLFELIGRNDYSDYGSQSARRGGATAALEAGVPTPMIREQGHWSINSTAVQRYMKPSVESQLTATSFLNKK